MKFNLPLYLNYRLPKNTPFFDVFTDGRRKSKTVTFQDNKKLPIYRWFPYKQGFSKSLVDNIIETHELKAGSIICDPFLGSGTTALAAIQKGYSAWGIDQLPLCVFIGRAKAYSMMLDPQSIIDAANVIVKSKVVVKHKWPNVTIVNKAIPLDVQNRMMELRQKIENSQVAPILRNTLLLALLSSIEDCAYIKKDGGFPRIVPDKLVKEIGEVFIQNCERFAEDLIIVRDELHEIPTSSIRSSIFRLGDARSTKLPDQSVDCVITSPPYLNKTDYTRVYSLELCLMFVNSFIELRQLRYESFSGHVEAKRIFPDRQLPESIGSTLNELKHSKLSNPKHPEMAEGYFLDLYYSLLDNFRYLKPGGTASWVVWNSRLSGIHFPVDVFLGELAETVGFHVQSIDCVRLTGTSAQQAKTYGDVPLRESIVHLVKKPNRRISRERISYKAALGR